MRKTYRVRFRLPWPIPGGRAVQRVAGPVDGCPPRVGDHDRGVSIEHLDAPLQELRPQEIVVARPLEVHAGRQMERLVVVVRGSQVLTVADVSDPAVLLRVAARDLLRAVRRRVVGDDELEVFERLRQDRIDRLRDVSLSVVHRHPDAGPRMLMHGQDPSLSAAIVHQYRPLRVNAPPAGSNRTFASIGCTRTATKASGKRSLPHPTLG